MNAARGRKYVEHIAMRISDMGISSELGHLILALRAVAPDAGWAWLRDWQCAYQRRATPREKRSKIVHPSRLIKLGRDLMDTADDRDQRRGSWAAVPGRPADRPAGDTPDAAAHLERPADQFARPQGRRHVYRRLARGGHQSGEPTEMPLPGWLTPYLTRYLERYRSLFPRAEADDHLWLSSKGWRAGRRSNLLAGMPENEAKSGCRRSRRTCFATSPRR